MYELRPYQQEAVNDAIDWLKKSLEPGLIEAYTASGKSIIVAEIARIITELTGKKVLVLQPTIELLEQNVEKYRSIGKNCSIFSASAGQRSVRFDVVYATALTVKNKLSSFCGKFGLVILDEADASLTPTILGIIKSLREKNPNLRVLGLTSSPYKLGYGYIYALDIDGKPVPADKAKEPFFAKQIVHISGRDLLDAGYVSPVTIGAINESYDTDGLEINSMGKFTSESIDRAFTGHGRKTSAIIADIISKSKDRRSVLIFASTHKHADECMASLPKELSAVLNDKTSKAERTRIIQDFKSFKIKYLVNVGILSRGFDHPGLDVVALLRATESSALLHQIIGRLVRLSPGKEDGLLLDYATNLDMHHPDGDLFSPEIKSWNDKKSSTQIIAECPMCSTENTFSARKNDEGYLYDSHGYFVDLTGERIKGDFGEIPSHHGRRCYGQELIRGKFERCLYYWTHKTCETCGEKCDISARYCSNKHELINPNDKLIAEYRPHKIDPYQAQKERVIAWTQKKMKSKRDEEMLMVTYITETRKFVIFYLVRRPEYGELMKATNGGDTMPTEIMYRKDKQSNFYRVLGYV